MTSIASIVTTQEIVVIVVIIVVIIVAIVISMAAIVVGRIITMAIDFHTIQIRSRISDIVFMATASASASSTTTKDRMI